MAARDARTRSRVGVWCEAASAWDARALTEPRWPSSRVGMTLSQLHGGSVPHSLSLIDQLRGSMADLTPLLQAAMAEDSTMVALVKARFSPGASGSGGGGLPLPSGGGSGSRVCNGLGGL